MVSVYCPLPITHCLLPIVYYPSSTAHSLLSNIYCPLSTGQCHVCPLQSSILCWRGSSRISPKTTSPQPSWGGSSGAKNVFKSTIAIWEVLENTYSPNHSSFNFIYVLQFVFEIVYIYPLPAPNRRWTVLQTYYSQSKTLTLSKDIIEEDCATEFGWRHFSTTAFS